MYFFFCTTLTSTHAYAYNALPLTSFYSLPMYIIVTHTRKEPLGEQGGRRTLRLCDLIPLMLAEEALSLETVNTETCKKGDRGKSERGMTGQGDGANQRGKFWAPPVALHLMASGNALHADFSRNWLTAIQSGVHACAYANSPELEPYLHTRAQSSQSSVCSQNFLINTLAHIWQKRKKGGEENPAFLPPP